MQQTLETLALCVGICVVELFLPVGGSVDHRMEKETWRWRIEVCGFHLEQSLHGNFEKE